ncbi:8-amino-7-oxononanoate synthase [Chryseobacterium taeanense]|uniref:8-amino-7-oxononanoate synthase n=1 Tax=Chryseobacterium taeanense TaxID=311334 RepID=UPI0035B3CD77
MSYNLIIYDTVSDLPENWNNVIGNHNIMLSEEYFNVLQNSSPSNMKCFFMGFFREEEIIGGALFQYLDFSRHRTFHKEKSGLVFSFKNLMIRCFIKDVMILGNNMLTGQNGFYFDSSKISSEEVVVLLNKAVQKMQNDIRKTSLIVYKDYQKCFIEHFKEKEHRTYFRFSVLPNMILNIREGWKTFDDYVNDFSKKYRARAKTAKRKLQDTERYEFNLDSLKKHQQKMNLLYHNVVENASFNTFFLPENHFEKMKESLGEKFKVFGYFSERKLIGFYTLILNNNDVDTYFLGYDKECQKQKQIYLNMLLDMVEFGIKYRFKRIVFGRTALEIKSTIGAEPSEIFGIMKHNNFILNKGIGEIFTSFAPKTEWLQRKPFK